MRRHDKLIKALRSNADQDIKKRETISRSFEGRSLLSLPLALLLSTMPTHASEISPGRVQLKGEALYAAYYEQTLDLAYNNEGFAGKKHHTETHNANGTTDYDEGGMRLDGEWSLSGPPGLEDKICYRYRQLNPDLQHCFWVFREGKCLYGYSVRWFPTLKSIRPEMWRVKGANREDGPSCDIFIS